MAKAPDFSSKIQFPAEALINGLQRKAEVENAQKVDDYTRRMQLVKQSVEQAGNVVSNMVENSKAKQKAQFVNTLAERLAASGAVQAQDPVKFDAIRSAVQINPEQASKDFLGETFAKPSSSDLSLQTKTVGVVGPDGKVSRAEVMVNPKNGQFLEAGTNRPITDKIVPDPRPEMMSPVAEVRKQNLIATLNDRMSKKMNPANWQPNSLAGKSAQIVANADSALSLAQQMKNKEVPITEANMTSLALDANRVLSQSSVTSEKIVQDLKAKTGYSKFADAITFFSNHPQDKRLDGFVDVLATELQRQRDQRQKLVDRTLAGEFASLKQLQRLSPEDWEAQVIANGFDPDEAKKGHLKIRPEVGSTMYGWNIGNSSQTPFQDQQGGIQIDHSALDAELKKRGL